MEGFGIRRAESELVNRVELHLLEKSMKRALFVLLFSSLLMLVACSNAGNSGNNAIPALEPVPAEFAGRTNPFGADAAAAGQGIYVSSCQSCHGPQGHGDGPAAGYLNPHPKNLAELQTQAGDDYLFWRISTGKSGTAMISWEGVLTEEQIWQIVAFIRTLK
jgi:mono/diheme cytochrome c family protein